MLSLSLDDFKSIELEDKEIIKKHHEKFPPVHSDNLFTTMISWKDYSDYHYTILKDNLILMTKVKGHIQFRPPSGKYNKDVFDQVHQLAKKEGNNPPIGMINLKTKEWLTLSKNRIVDSDSQPHNSTTCNV